MIHAWLSGTLNGASFLVPALSALVAAVVIGAVGGALRGWQEIRRERAIIEPMNGGHRD